MIIYYDGYCSLCRTSSTIWKKLDWRNKLSFTSFRTLKEYPAEMEKQLFVDHHGKWFKGFNAIIQIAKMLPLLWITVPFLYIFKWIGLGSFIYNIVAKNRKIIPVNQCDDDTCTIHPNQDPFS
ncbi:putative DCC family thiol-disulfide oxidoreductase YuxK [Virgibacillus halotolerans]|uniref:thiol-disulfide oxidoreductase DCC family protein n=1 Tax=Virgibacillus halotolerans TaxID=1071053 RepID=UPI00195FB4A7|nr:DUF393 domain-containing protein [Virgibacillus halotolerans]MBM7598792.1 putative DCC family thiol-disulfide oxidoreductase YuxK [Virgibacillus halotolerans]